VKRRGPDWKQLAAIGVASFALTLGLFALAWVIRRHSAWPTEKSDNLLLIGILILGLIPLALVLVYALLQRGGSLSFQGITIDLAATTSPAVDFRVDTNIGAPGQAVSDTSSMQILDALAKSAASDVVIVDLEDGKAWWETRLLVLAAGAVRTGRPRALVFVATTAEQTRTFLGWAPPKSVLDALLDQRNPRYATYLKTYGLALETAQTWEKEAEARTAPAPAPPESIPWNWGPWVLNVFGKPNAFVPEQLLALALSNLIEETWKAVPPPTDPDAPSTEKYPKAVTITIDTLNTQFADGLHRTAIEETGTSEEQVDAFLRDTGEIAPITRDGAYVRTATRSALMEGLVQQLLVSARAG